MTQIYVQITFEISATETKNIRTNLLQHINACEVDSILYLDTTPWIQKNTT